MVATSQPAFCKSCHEMQNDYDSWSSSAHAKVTCTACHIGPGVSALIIHKIGSLIHEMPAHFLHFGKYTINENSEVSVDLPSNNCLDCHVRPKGKYFKNLVFVHTKHRELNCAYCHNRIAHSGLKGYKNRATMMLCINCHKKKNKPTHCLFCHTPSIMQKPPTHKSADWVPKAHETQIDIGCTFCHKRNFCSTCHQKIRK
jgi:hypothetical protein